ncbi:MAG: N-acetylneuraminate synthase [Oligoflexales bacterium]
MENLNNVFIIAEAGVNHNGDFDMARRLVDAAKEAGADAVKFQTFHAASLASSFAPKASYQLETTDPTKSQYDMLKSLELREIEYVRLKEYSDKNGIEFLSSPFDPQNLRFLCELGIKKIKIPSGEITHLALLEGAARVGLEVILSTGMSFLGEVERAVDVLTSGGLPREDITILQCNTEYPTPVHDVNLKAMVTLGKSMRTQCGYSDHTTGIHIPVAAVAMGASMIEKHLTLDKTFSGPDHRASLEPEEFKTMVNWIRETELAIGDGLKRPSSSEKRNRYIARKSLVASSVIKKGEIFTPDNLTAKRPGTGMSPMDWDLVLGKPAPKDFSIDDMVTL